MSRENYPKISIEGFIQEVKIDLDVFARNMKALKVEPKNYPDWAEMFLAWAEVGTAEEEESFG